jgi:cell shape-determining protein MreC
MPAKEEQSKVTLDKQELIVCLQRLQDIVSDTMADVRSLVEDMRLQVYHSERLRQQNERLKSRITELEQQALEASLNLLGPR